MKHSFEPFGIEETMALSAATGVDFTHINFNTPRWLCVSGRDDEGVLIGVCCFEFKTWFDAHFNIAVRHSSCINRRVMRAMFRAVFSRAVRVTAHVDPMADRTIKLAQRMGFQIEGYKRLGIEGTRDALVLGMLAEDCIYLPRQPRRPASFPVRRVNEDGLNA